jgi:hypothetical protein
MIPRIRTEKCSKDLKLHIRWKSLEGKNAILRFQVVYIIFIRVLVDQHCCAGCLLNLDTCRDASLERRNLWREGRSSSQALEVRARMFESGVFPTKGEGSCAVIGSVASKRSAKVRILMRASISIFTVKL